MIASKKKIASWMLVAVAFATTATACGDDDSTKTTTTVAAGSDATTGDAAGGGGDAVSSNPDVVAFCKSAEELGAEFKKVMADPTSGDITALTASANELTSQATTLTSASPADAQAISDCLTAMSTAMTGG
jgi:hypothetical protein